MAITALTAAPAQANESGLSAAERALLASDKPKTLTLDVKTGDIVAVTPGYPIRPTISNTNFCQSSDACFYSGQVPYADQGFFGTNGTITGSWPSRSGGWSGGYKAKFCWGSGTCGPVLDPLTPFNFGGSLVTGTSVTISGHV
ncbi:hypothetical protein AB0I90_31605 [Micromonospora wenchangensis]|uniref:hypothetical protein n=1 Tax=Micromonospora wenchangensis TaxID=1185415 RepID=UPI0033F83D5D